MTPAASNAAANAGGGGADSRGAVNFTMFLTMMGEHLLRLDKEEELSDAFGSFDEGDEGVVKVEELREWLGTTGDKMSQQEVRLSTL